MAFDSLKQWLELDADGHFDPVFASLNIEPIQTIFLWLKFVAGCREVMKPPNLNCFEDYIWLQQELFFFLVLVRYPFNFIQNLLRSWYVRHVVVLLDIDSKVAPNDKARGEFQQTHSANTTVATKAFPRQIGKSWKGWQAWWEVAVHVQILLSNSFVVWIWR